MSAYEIYMQAKSAAFLSSLGEARPIALGAMIGAPLREGIGEVEANSRGRHVSNDDRLRWLAEGATLGAAGPAAGYIHRSMK